jgi:hypothetical protein
MKYKFLTVTSALLTIGLLSAVLFLDWPWFGLASAQTMTTTAAASRHEPTNRGGWWWFSPVGPGADKWHDAPSGNSNWRASGARWDSGWTQAQWDWQAKEDIRARMTRGRQAWSPVQGTFQTDVNWSPDWELRWWAFKGSKSRTVWAYHVRSKRSAERFTSVLDPSTGQWQYWQSAR